MNASLIERKIKRKKQQRTMIICARIMSFTLGFAVLGFIIISIMTIYIASQQSTYQTKSNDIRNQACKFTVKGQFSVSNVIHVEASSRGEFAVSHKDGISVIDRAGNKKYDYDIELDFFFISDRNIYGTPNLVDNDRFFSIRLNELHSRAESLPPEYTYTMMTAENDHEKFLIVGFRTVNDIRVSSIIRYNGTQFICDPIENFEVKSIIYISSTRYYLIGNGYNEKKEKKAGIYMYYSDGLKGHMLAEYENAEGITDGIFSFPAIFAWNVTGGKTYIYSYNLLNKTTKKTTYDFPISERRKCLIAGEGGMICANTLNGILTSLVKIDKNLGPVEPVKFDEQEKLVSFSSTKTDAIIMLTESKTSAEYLLYEMLDKIESEPKQTFKKGDSVIDFFSTSDYGEFGIVSHHKNNEENYYVSKFSERITISTILNLCINL